MPIEEGTVPGRLLKGGTKNRPPDVPREKEKYWLDKKIPTVCSEYQSREGTHSLLFWKRFVDTF